MKRSRWPRLHSKASIEISRRHRRATADSSPTTAHRVAGEVSRRRWSRHGQAPDDDRAEKIHRGPRRSPTRKTGALGASPRVKPGDALFVAQRCPLQSHEYVTPMAAALFKAGFGKDEKVTHPESVFAFRDHLTFLDLVMPKRPPRHGPRRSRLKQARASCKQELRRCEHGAPPLRRGPPRREAGRLRGDLSQHGDRRARPPRTDIITGTDSHTCMGRRARAAFAFGVGSTDMANAWFTKRRARHASPRPCSSSSGTHDEGPASAPRT